MEQELVSAVLAMDDTIAIETKKEKFVVFIDTQVDFMVEGSALYVAGAQDLIGKLNNFAYHLKPEETAGVLFTFDTHRTETYDSMPESKQFPIHCVYGTPGWENVINFNVVNHDIPFYNLEKGVFNMWEEDDVFLSGIEADINRDLFFDTLKACGVDTVVIVGVAADFCVKWAADGFLARGFNVEIPRSLTAGIVRDIDTMVAEDYAGQNIKVLG
jgi:nicotinamidase/pyrazinamidase